MEFNLYREGFNAEEAHLLNPLTLAFIGDAVYEVFIRTYLVNIHKNMKVQQLHLNTVNYVKAQGQSVYAKRIIDLLDEKEMAVFKRGRNSKSGVPKNASVSDYRWATGFEAVIGYIYLTGNNERLNYLLEKVVKENDDEQNEG